MKIVIQTKFNRNRTSSTTFRNTVPSVLLPDRVPTLAKIAEQFISGRPIDQSLNRNLGYNEFENNPLLQKGIDLADIPKIAKKVGATLEEATEQIKQAQVEKGTKAQAANPSVTPPEQVE